MSIETVLIAVEEDLLQAARGGWTVVKTALERLLPEALQVLKDLFNEAVKDLEEGLSVDEIVTKVLNLAEAGGHQWIVDLETSVLRGLAGLLTAKAVA